MKNLLLLLLFSVISPCLLSARQQSDSSKVKFTLKPDAVRISADIFYPIVNAFSSGKSQFEGSIDVSFGPHFLVADLGTASYDATGTSNQYTQSGTFFRFGFETNVVARRLREGNAVFVGLKWGHAGFKETVSSSQSSPVFGGSTFSGENRLNANWAELNFGMKYHLWKYLFLGYTIRYKFLAGTSGEEGFNAYRIPGYGNAGKNQFGLNYYIAFRFPVKRTKKE